MVVPTGRARMRRLKVHKRWLCVLTEVGSSHRRRSGEKCTCEVCGRRCFTVSGSALFLARYAPRAERVAMSPEQAKAGIGRTFDGTERTLSARYRLRTLILCRVAASGPGVPLPSLIVPKGRQSMRLCGFGISESGLRVEEFCRIFLLAGPARAQDGFTDSGMCRSPAAGGL